MVEYIDREALIAEYDRVHVGAPGGARKLMIEAPAADVVPRAEAEAKCEACACKLLDERDRARAVIDEIFWEIDKLLTVIYTDDEEGSKFIGVDMQKYYALKKKYTGEEK